MNFEIDVLGRLFLTCIVPQGAVSFVNMAHITTFAATPFSSHQLNSIFPILMILVGSCTLDIADDIMWLKLSYWPFDCKVDLPQVMAAEYCKFCRCSC